MPSPTHSERLVMINSQSNLFDICNPQPQTLFDTCEPIFNLLTHRPYSSLTLRSLANPPWEPLTQYPPARTILDTMAAISTLNSKP